MLTYEQALRDLASYSDEITRLRALTAELMAKAKGENSCPICGGVEGCDHTVSERARAPVKAKG